MTPSTPSSLTQAYANQRFNARVALMSMMTVAMLCTGCGMLPQTGKVDLVETPPVRPASHIPAVAPPITGSLFHTATFRPALEDRRAKLLGDIVTIAIVENISAVQKKTTALGRTGSTSAGVTGLPFMNVASLAKLAVGGTSATTFAGSGDNETTNTFTGSIAATVVEVLPNGHLIVAGEKQVGLNQDVDVLRFSGTIDPRDIQPGSVVSSTQVANARIQSRGRGAQDEAQTVGWLSRFFLSVMPF